MFRFGTNRNNKVSTPNQIPFVKNQNFMKRINYNAKCESECHSCMRSVMRLSRWFGLFPVEGLERSSLDKLKFNLKSFYGVYYIVTFFGQVINTIVSLISVFQSGETLSLLTSTIFYANGVVSTVLLFDTARNWSSLVKKATALEKASGIRLNKCTSKKIVLLAYATNVFGLIEHCLAVNYFVKHIKGCNPEYNSSEVITTYLFPKMPYNIAHSNILQFIFQIYLEIIGKQETFLWSFTDIVNISMTMYLTAYFNKLNKLIFAGKDSKSTNWKKLRKQQGILVQLVHLINDHFNYYVFLSCLCNMWFLCVQLYNTFRITAFKEDNCDQKGITDLLHSFDHHAYFVISFAYLMFRTLMLCHLAANLYAIARRPLIALGNIHPLTYDIEIQRFNRQINYTTIGVNGVFFYITRATILKVISSLVTYELLLIQINNVKFSHLSAFNVASNVTSNNSLHSLYSNGSISIW